MKIKENWKEKKIGLVLSGGGAKGAYQVGMFRALEELDLAKQITVISGTSIGALDALIYSAAGVEAVRELLWCFGSQITEECRQTDAETIALKREEVEQGGVTISRFISEPEFSEYHTGVFQDFLKELLPDESLKTVSRKVYACAYSLERERPEYFCLNQLPPSEQRKLILASASLPFVFPPVKFKGEHYLDGGVIPLVCGKNAAPADKIPLKPVLGEAVDAILVNFLNPADVIDKSGVPDGVDYVELRPSQPLEKYPGEGTLDFSPERLKSHEALGYEDTKQLFSI